MDKKLVTQCKHYNKAGTCKWLTLLFRMERRGEVKEMACVAMQNSDCPILDLELRVAVLEKERGI